jgi:hypothetical protein
MKYFNDPEYLIKTMSGKDLSRLVIITANGKRVLQTLYFDGITAKINELIFTDMNEWETRYRMNWSTFCKMIQDKKIIGYYWMN